ncbi:MAG TPA: FixH family protein [Kofleriaceae bacterium]
MRISIVRPTGAKSALMIGLAACGTDDNGDDEEVVDCSKVTDVDTFVVGLEHAGDKGTYNFRFISGTPAPPQRGPENTWVVQINSMNAGVVGAPVDGVTMKVTPFMPKHMHGSGVPVEIMPLAEPGQYQLSTINLWMQGVWEITMRATVDPSTDSTVFSFCIP